MTVREACWRGAAVTAFSMLCGALLGHYGLPLWTAAVTGLLLALVNYLV